MGHAYSKDGHFMYGLFLNSCFPLLARLLAFILVYVRNIPERHLSSPSSTPYLQHGISDLFLCLLSYGLDFSLGITLSLQALSLSVPFFFTETVLPSPPLTTGLLTVWSSFAGVTSFIVVICCTHWPPLVTSLWQYQMLLPLLVWRRRCPHVGWEEACEWVQRSWSAIRMI